MPRYSDYYVRVWAKSLAGLPLVESGSTQSSYVQALCWIRFWETLDSYTSGVPDDIEIEARRIFDEEGVEQFLTRAEAEQRIEAREGEIEQEAEAWRQKQEEDLPEAP